MKKQSDEKKTIGVLFYDFSVKAGGQRVAANVFNQLSRDGYSVVIISIFFREGKGAFSLEDNIKLIALNEGDGRFRKVAKKSIKQCAEIIKKERISVLVAEGFSADLLAYIMSRKCKIPFIHCEHTSLENKVYSAGIGSKIYRYLGVHKSKKIVALTQRNKDSFCKEYSVSADKIVVIPNWIEDVPEKQAKYDAESKVILSMGRADSVKGFDRLVEIASGIVDSCQGWEWQIWGNCNNSYGEEIKAKIHEKGLDAFVKTMGVTDDTKKVYSDSSFFVLTSYFEGLPMSLLEAGASKLPLIAFDIPTGPSEIIDDKVNGYLIKDGDLDQMKKAILTLVNDKDERIRLSENSEVNLQKYAKDRVLTKWYDLLAEYV